MVDEEGRLLALARSGDRSAFDALFGPLINPAYRFAYGMLQDRPAAEDAVQDAALHAWTRLGNVRAGAAVRPWFFGIVANQCRTYRRGRWWSVIRQASPERSADSPEDRIVAGSDLGRAMKRLDADRLEALVLHYNLGLPLDDVALITHVPIGTVKSRIHRAIEQLRPQVGPGVEVRA
jgi:RNA polymerase sigma-70 factor (ECF subfamily)